MATWTTERVRHVLGAVPALLYEMALDNGEVVEFIGCEALLGCPEGTLRRHADLLGRIHPDDVEYYLAQRGDGPRPGDVIEYRIRHEDGHYLRVRDHALEASPDRRLGVMTDTSPCRQLEERRRELEARKNAFLRVLAHELRNPLAVLRTGLHLLAQDVEQHLRDQTLKAFDHQLLVLGRLATDVSDVAQVGDGALGLERRHVDLVEIVRQIGLVMQPRFAEREQTFTLACPSSSIPLFGDPERLQQVLLNLLGNANKYTPTGGDVGLHLNVVDGHVDIVVRDDGEGMSADFVPRAFELFSRDDWSSLRYGLGVGLYIVKYLVEEHGGEVWAESGGKSCGSTFRVRLPLAPDRSGDGPADGVRPRPTE